MLLAGWDGRTGWDGGGMEGPTLAGAGSGAQRGSGKRWLTPIVSELKGRGLFLSEQQNNTNRLHTNRNQHVVQDIIKNTYDTIVLWLHTNPDL